MKVFLLRFEKMLPYHETAPVPVTMGTRTETYTAREGSDSDRTLGEVSAIPIGLSVMSGTQTITAVRAEAVDSDPGSVSFTAIPR